MTREHISLPGQSSHNVVRHANPADYRPTPEQLEELPDPTFNLERMETGQIVSLVVGIGKLLDQDGGMDALTKNDSNNIAELTAFMARDLACLPARDLEKARKVIFALAEHPDPYARGTATDVMDSLLRFQSEGYNERQQVIDLWLRLLQDEDQEVREGTRHSMSRTIDSGWIGEPMARYLDSKLPPDFQREEWWKE